jgi:hypothetical protein
MNSLMKWRSLELVVEEVVWIEIELVKQLGFVVTPDDHGG